eukprot:m.16705 g.16705  ORF g.16705 m.16705 type:complete len:281 (+) comp5770_c0_seq1:103-945(+)
MPPKKKSKASTKKPKATKKRKQEEEAVAEPPKKAKKTTKKGSKKAPAKPPAPAKKTTKTTKKASKKVPVKKAATKKPATKKPAPAKKASVKKAPVKKASSVSLDVDVLKPGDEEEVGSYTVMRAYSGYYTCDCPAFKFKKGKVGTKVCKHIESLGIGVKEQQAAGGGGSSAMKKMPAFKLKKRMTVSKDEKEELQGKTLPDLKDMLRNNSQVVGGTKKELVARIIYCMEFGCLPRCHKCGGGRIKKQGNSFVCPGFMDDDTFQFCGFQSNGSDLDFPDWR